MKKELINKFRELIESRKGKFLTGSEIDFVWRESLQYHPEHPSRDSIKTIEVRQNWSYNRNTWGLFVNGREFWSWTKGVKEREV